MKYFNLTQPIKIIGIEIRTTNDNAAAFRDIPPHWQTFFENNTFEKIPNKISNSIYGIYTNFEHEGHDSRGMYSFIIGAQVDSFKKVPKGFVTVEIPSSLYRIFPVEKGHPEKVGEKWQEIWQHTFEKQRTFRLEFERYSEDGDIHIFVGVEE